MAKYAEKKELLDEIIKSKALNELTTRAQQILFKIADEAIKRLPYEDYQDRKDCLQTAKMDLWLYWRNFDEKLYDNPFAYYTEMCKRGYYKGFNELTKRDKKFKGKISLNSSNNGDGIYNLH